MVARVRAGLPPGVGLVRVGLEAAGHYLLPWTGPGVLPAEWELFEPLLARCARLHALPMLEHAGQFLAVHLDPLPAQGDQSAVGAHQRCELRLACGSRRRSVRHHCARDAERIGLESFVQDI